MNALGVHLGVRMSSLTDGELGDSARERALAHVASCEHCRADLERERGVRATLRAMPDPVPAAGLTARLLAIADPVVPVAPPGPSQGRREPAGAGPGRSADARSARPHGSGVPSRPPAPRRSVRRRTRAVATGAISLVLVVLGTALVVGTELGGADPRPVDLSETTATVGPISPGLSVVTASFVEAPSRWLAPTGPLWTAPTPTSSVDVLRLAPTGP